MGKVIVICYGCAGTGKDAQGRTCQRCGGSRRDPNP